MNHDTDRISRAEADRQTQEAVAAVLMEAARLARAAHDGEIAYDDILALTPEDAREAEAMVAAAIKGLRQHLGNLTYDAARIDDYITSDADAALAKMLVEARAEGMREAAKVCEKNAKIQREKLESLKDHLDDHEKGALIGATVASKQMAAAILARAVEIREKNDEW